MFLNLAAFVKRSRVNGPGLRAVLWVKGCPHRCPGCFNPDMQPFSVEEIFSVAETAARIISLKDIEGITFTGGEPFAQAAALAELGGILQKKGLNIVTYTGYTLENLKEGENGEWNRLLAVTDLLIDGPFIKKQQGDFPMRGSANQRLFFLTDRLENHPDLERKGREVEILIKPDGDLVLTGFP